MYGMLFLLDRIYTIAPQGNILFILLILSDSSCVCWTGWMGFFYRKDVADSEGVRGAGFRGTGRKETY